MTSLTRRELSLPGKEKLITACVLLRHCDLAELGLSALNETSHVKGLSKLKLCRSSLSTDSP